ncbi:superoxide dismutase family protein [Caulobacter sp. SL161]|uniref:superoxide dismutase[Cu-Zn] n=1 Tax=Caulobacter sp. SL161 TaxID=2995156 RepID=UPI002272D1BD|nr:superoxide dismutase family protein [Caulobacter sp. SL161]MCY1647595.1 superoxide dismutase family protein [Caulobacter sp. SL161]
MTRLTVAAGLGLAALIAASPALAQSIATAVVKAGDGKDAGVVTVTEAPRGVLLKLELKGLTPGWHAVHFHEKGDCGTPDFKSAGAHVHSAATTVHGLLNPDANDNGDLPNIFAGPDGSATAEIYSTLVSLKGAGDRPALLDADGSSIVVHANPDDHKTQPIGGAGARVACGVIK